MAARKLKSSPSFFSLSLYLFPPWHTAMSPLQLFPLSTGFGKPWGHHFLSNTKYHNRYRNEKRGLWCGWNYPAESTKRTQTVGLSAECTVLDQRSLMFSGQGRTPKKKVRACSLPCFSQLSIHVWSMALFPRDRDSGGWQKIRHQENDWVSVVRFVLK